MSQLHRRQANLLYGSGYVSFAQGYTVTAYEVGGEAASNVTGSGGSTTIAMRAGHGFATNDYAMQNLAPTAFAKVTGVSGNNVTVNANWTVTAGDSFVNLGPNETGTTSPNYDGSGITIYSDMAGGSSVTASRVTADSVGNYGYFHWGQRRIWELVRNGSGTPVLLVKEAHPVYFARGTSLPTVGEPGIPFLKDQASGSGDVIYLSAEFQTNAVDWLEEFVADNS